MTFFSSLLFALQALFLLASCSHITSQTMAPSDSSSSKQTLGNSKVKERKEGQIKDVKIRNVQEEETRKETELEHYTNSPSEKNLKIISNRLEELTTSAKSIGDHAVNYLSSDLFLKANAAATQGDWMTASVLFKHLITLVPQDDYLKQKYAESLIRVGQLNEAQSHLQYLYKKSNMKNEKIGLILAGVYTALLEKEEARKIYSQILKRNPKGTDACIFLAKSFAQEGKTIKSIEILNGCENENPKSPVYSYYKGKFLLENGENDSALIQFKKSLRLDPLNAKTVLAIGVLYEEKGKMEDALKIYQDYLNKGPTDNLILNKLVQVLLSLSKNKAAIPYLETLSQIDPENLNLKVKLGIIFTEVGNFEKAKEVFLNLYAQVPNSDKILYYLGAIYQETNDFEKAIEFFSKIPSDSSLFHGSQIQVANMLMTLAISEKFSEGSLSPHSKTKAFLDFIHEKTQKIPQIKIQLSVIKASFFESKDEIKKSIEILESLKSLKEFDNSHAYYLATLYEKVHRYDEAYSLAMAIIKEDPQNAHAWNFLGYSLLEREQDLNKAYEYIQRAIALKPDDGFIRDSLGWYYYKIGKLDLALKEMQKAREVVPDDVIISKHLAMVYQSLKQYNLAKKYYAEALKNSKVESERHLVLKAMESLVKKQERVPASVPSTTESTSESTFQVPKKE